MKKIFITLIITCLFIACKTTQINYGNTYSDQSTTNAMTQKQYSFNRKQFNDACKTYYISSDLKKWKKTTFVDAESLKPFSQYIFIKSGDKQDIISKTTYILDLNISDRNDTTFNLKVRSLVK